MVYDPYDFLSVQGHIPRKGTRTCLLSWSAVDGSTGLLSIIIKVAL